MSIFSTMVLSIAGSLIRVAEPIADVAQPQAKLMRNQSQIAGERTESRDGSGAQKDSKSVVAKQPKRIPSAGADSRKSTGKKYSTPLSKIRITSGYGYRTHPITGENDFHAGLDLAARLNQPVRAITAGTVTRAGWRGALGKAVEIKSGNTSSIYGHLNKVLVTKGQEVSDGHLIGLAGSTGRSTGPHLHLSIRRNHVSVSPLAYFRQLDRGIELTPPAVASSAHKAVASSEVSGASSRVAGVKKSGKTKSTIALARSKQLRKHSTIARSRTQTKRTTAVASAQKSSGSSASIPTKLPVVAVVPSTPKKVDESKIREAKAEFDRALAESRKFDYLYNEGAVSRNDAEERRNLAQAAKERLDSLGNSDS